MPPRPNEHRTRVLSLDVVLRLWPLGQARFGFTIADFKQFGSCVGSVWHRLSQMRLDHFIMVHRGLRFAIREWVLPL